jgi:uncharacterized surface protein with fasciclin (FAS1) repeats
VPGRLTSAEVTKMDTLRASRDAPSPSTSDGVKVNDAKVIQADVAADNGVIHVIDRVMLPK